MLRSYILTSFRNLTRNKAYTAINMLGLGLGLAIFLLLAQYVAHESAANQFNPRYDRLYRVQVMNKEGKADYHLPPGYAPLVQQQFPAVEQAVRFAEEIGGGTVERPEIPGFEALRDSRILYADSGFLNAFAFPLLRGSATLAAPNTLALSEAMAEKLFGKDEALNKTLLVRN
jgi:putative ABC transport system permease protein